MRGRTLLTGLALIFSLASSAALAAAPTSPITVTVEGAGPDIVLIPGLASSTEVWADLAGRLRPHYRLHRVQLAGFAGAPALASADGQVAAPSVQALADYIRREHLEAPTIIGHSLGGEMALMLGARHPEQVGSLLVVDALPFYPLLMNPAATSAALQPQAQALREAMLVAPAEQAAAMQRAAVERLVKTEAARPAVVAAALSSDRQTVADATYELMTTDLRPELGQIRVPVEVVYAYDGAYGISAQAVDTLFRGAYATLPTVKLTRVEGSFHFVMLDQPEAFAEVVEAFLRR